MGQEPELKNTNSLQKEFQNLLDKDFKDRKLKENEIIKATVTEITKNFVVVDCKAKMEGMIPIEEFKNDEDLVNEILSTPGNINFFINAWAKQLFLEYDLEYPIKISNPKMLTKKIV